MEGSIFLQTYGYFHEGAVGNLLAQWEAMGFFSYVIPFLLMFAIVFGILIQMKMFRDNKAINAIIALAVALMALQFDFVPRFFSEIFPRVGVGLVILLLVLIFTGLFIDAESRGMMYLMWAVGAVVVIVILLQTAGSVGWYSFMPWLGYNWPAVLAAVAFVAIIIVIIASSVPRAKKKPVQSILSQLIKEGK